MLIKDALRNCEWTFMSRTQIHNNFRAGNMNLVKFHYVIRRQVECLSRNAGRVDLNSLPFHAPAIPILAEKSGGTHQAREADSQFWQS